MNKFAITSLGFVSLLILTYVGISQLSAFKKGADDKGVHQVELPSGLKYRILKEGTGATPQKGQNVFVHYEGWLDKNGEPDLEKLFDSSVKRGQPFSFPLGMGYVIKGWDEGVGSMKVGEKRHLIIPAALAYGASAVGTIPANSTLHFYVELLSIA